jgi:hypothetical protein
MTLLRAAERLTRCCPSRRSCRAAWDQSLRAVTAFAEADVTGSSPVSPIAADSSDAGVSELLEGIACRGVRPPLLQARPRDPLIPIA